MFSFFDRLPILFRSRKVRLKFAQQIVSPNPKQIERGLTLGLLDIRKSWVIRSNITFTEKQVVRGLTGGKRELRLSWLERKDLSLSALNRVVVAR